jgi:hypothetical protein
MGGRWTLGYNPTSCSLDAFLVFFFAQCEHALRVAIELIDEVLRECSCRSLPLSPEQYRHPSLFASFPRASSTQDIREGSAATTVMRVFCPGAICVVTLRS